MTVEALGGAEKVFRGTSHRIRFVNWRARNVRIRLNQELRGIGLWVRLLSDTSINSVIPKC